MKKFEIGKEYTHGWIGDSDLHTTWKVIARTAQTITIQEGDIIRRCRVNKYLTELEGSETIYPFGQYSMAPTLRA